MECLKKQKKERLKEETSIACSSRNERELQRTMNDMLTTLAEGTQYECEVKKVFTYLEALRNSRYL